MMKRIQDITVGIISLVLFFIMITVLNRVIFSATECPDWIPFPPDYHSVCLIQTDPGFFQQLGNIIVGVAWPF